ncbi:hypothetical protein C0581_00790 [Candidatus Parcubacteria bacterium]|nr:MAG: hypothetical protein C0581_00790 [Candidatus Parcubacteria bacterium]
MRTYDIANKAQLLDLVGASCPDPSFTGPKVVEATIWDGRKVSASYYRGKKWETPDAETSYDIFYDVKPLVPFVERMLDSGESFVTITGEDDMVCCLEWSIETP